MLLSWDFIFSQMSEIPTTTKTIIGCTTLLLLIGWLTRKTDRLPPGPRALPFIGNLLSMRKTALETLINEWKEKYGPIFTIYLGPLRTVVITDIDLTTDALVKQGSAYSGRPYLYSLDKLSQGSQDIVAASYGEFWKFQRRIAVQALRQYLLGNQFEERVHETLQIVCQNMEKETGAIDIHMHLSHGVFNILHGLCFGDILDFDNPNFRKMVHIIDSLQEKAANGFLEDLIPPLRIWPSKKFTEAMEDISWLNGYIYKRMEEIRSHFNEDALTCLGDNILQAEKLSQLEGHSQGHKLSNTHTAQILVNVFGAGVDTTRVSLDWIFLVLVNHRDVQARMHQEIDAVIGQKVPGREHRSRLVYCQAVIFETLRLYPVSAYGIPHETTCDAEIGGYNIPKKTAVLFSFLTALRDPKHWEDPLTFKPERFLDDTQSQVVVRSKSFIPFSLGHRSCPGEGLAKGEILYVVVGLLQKFSFSFPAGEETQLCTLVEGFTNKPPPFKVVIKRR